MNVQPDLLHHPKYLHLKQRLGQRALELLLKLWGHCQQNQRGERWTEGDPIYVETVIGWNGKRGVAYQALLDLGWIKLETPGLRVHDWDWHNASLISAWVKGETTKRNFLERNGRAKAPAMADAPAPANAQAKAPVDAPASAPAQAQPGASGGEWRGVEGSACPPTPQGGVAAPAHSGSVHPGDVPDTEAVLNFAAGWPGEPVSATPGPIPVDYVTAWMARREMARGGFGRHWQRLLVSCWRADWKRFQAEKAAEAAKPKPYAPLVLPPPPDPSWPDDLETLDAMIDSYRNDNPAKASALRKYRYEVADALRAQGRSVPE